MTADQESRGRMFNWRSTLGMQSEPEAKIFRPPIFVIGCMRSGTTFLVDKLTQHPQLLKVGNELRQVWTDVGGAPSTDVASLARVAEDATPQATANMTKYFVDFVNSARTVRRHAMRSKNRVLRKQSRVFYDWDKVIPVNKSTQLVNKIGYAHALFPGSPIVFIIRSIEGHCASMKAFIEHNHREDDFVHVLPEGTNDAWTRIKAGADFVGRTFPSDFSTLTEMWLRLNSFAVSELEKLPEDLYRIVRYEDLVTHQEEVLKSIFSFLPVDPEFSSEADQISSAVLEFKNTTTSGDSLTKWKDQLSDAEKLLINQVRDTDPWKSLEAKISRHAIVPQLPPQ